MKRINILLISLLITSFFISCKKKDDVDTTKPQITIDKPVNNDVFAIGEKIYFTASFSDNKELKDCKVSLSFVSGDGDGTPWSPGLMTILLSGTSDSVEDEVLFGTAIPECKPGTYKLTFELSDNADVPNTSTKEVNIDIISTAPVLNVIKPVNGAQFTAGADFLTLSATCSDNKELKELKYTVTYISTSVNNLKGATGINDPWEPGTSSISLSGQEATITDEMLYGGQIPESKAGNYKLTLELLDTDGNSTIQEIDFMLVDQ